MKSADDEKQDYIINSDGTVTIHGAAGDYKVDFGEFMMGYAPMSIVAKVCEPI